MPRGTPSLRQYKKWRSGLFLRFVYAFVVLQVLFQAGRMGWVPRFVGIAALALLPLSVIGVIVMHVRYRARMRAYAASVNGEACIDCGYPLGALANVAACPECGATVDLAATREAWQKVL